MEYYAAEKKMEYLPFATAWMELETVMLSEILSIIGERQVSFDLTYKRKVVNKIMSKIEPKAWNQGTD